MDACDGDKACMFDAAQSGSLEVGISSHEAKQKSEKVTAALGKNFE